MRMTRGADEREKLELFCQGLTTAYHLIVQHVDSLACVLYPDLVYTAEPFFYLGNSSSQNVGERP